jgi:transcription antitermination protein NusB
VSRRAARLAAVELLYGLDVRGDGEGVEEQGQDAYSQHLVRGVRDRLPDLDEVIRRYAVGWAPERMSVVDRNILRVAAFELLEDEVPAPAVIDEAVSIAKKLSGVKAGRFVNGVLEAVRQVLD